MKKNFMVRLEEKTIGTLRDISRAEKRPMGNVVRLIIEDRLDQLETEIKGESINHGNR